MEVQLLQFHIKWMLFLGLWPNGSRSFYNIIHTFLIFINQLFNLTGGTINLIHCSGKLNCIFENVTYTFLTLSSLYTFVVFLFNERLYQAATITLHNLMDEFKTHTYTWRAEKFTRVVAVICTVYCSLGLLQYNVAPLIDYADCVKRDNEGSALTCGLPTPGWFPFDCTTSPGFEIAYVLQVIWAILCIKSVSQPIMLSSSITYHVIAHLKMIQDNLKQVCNRRLEDRCDSLGHIIRHHVAVLDLSNLVSAAFNELLLMYAVVMSLIFCVVGFQIIQMFVTMTINFWNLARYLIVFVGYFTILLVLSLLGQQLIDESTAISDCAYEIPWYDESIQFQKMIQLVILRANKPLVLKSASISDVSFPSFSKVMSSTYSYLAMMLQVLLVNEDN